MVKSCKFAFTWTCVAARICLLVNSSVGSISINDAFAIFTFIAVHPIDVKHATHNDKPDQQKR